MNTQYKSEYRVKQAKEFEANGMMLHALQVYQSIIEEEPEFFEAYFELACLYEELDNIRASYNLLDEALLNFPNEDKLRLYYGQFLLSNNKWNKAIEILSLADVEKNSIVSFFIGYSYFALKEYELARLNFLSFISNVSDSELIYEAYLYLSKIEIQLSNFENALKYAKKSEALYSNFWELNLIFGIIYYHLNMHTHALASIEKTMKLNPKEPSVYEWSGNIYLKVGEYLKAESQFKKYIESIENASSDTYTKLAQACLKLDKAEDAAAYFDVAVKLDPKNKTAAEGKEKATHLIINRASDG